jgi:hypothetical protein
MAGIARGELALHVLGEPGGETMAHVREDFLRELEGRLAHLSTWLAGRRRAGEQVPDRLHARVQSVMGDIAGVRHAAANDVHHVVARARATLEDIDRDYEAPPSHVALRREEFQALRWHLRLVARLLPHVSNLDDPGWAAAHEEYERSWGEVRHALDPEGSAAAP